MEKPLRSHSCSGLSSGVYGPVYDSHWLRSVERTSRGHALSGGSGASLCGLPASHPHIGIRSVGCDNRLRTGPQFKNSHSNLCMAYRLYANLRVNRDGVAAYRCVCVNVHSGSLAGWAPINAHMLARSPKQRPSSTNPLSGDPLASPASAKPGSASLTLFRKPVGMFATANRHVAMRTACAPVPKVSRSFGPGVR